MSDDEPVEASPADEPLSEADPRPARPRRLRWWQEGALLATVAIVLAVLLKTFVVQAYYIPSASMVPGLQTDDRILVQKVSYWFGGSPQRGDVVVFEDPGGWITDPAETETHGGVRGVLARIGLYPHVGHLVKRVVGLPGDTVSCCDDEGRIMVNGDPLDEDAYLAEAPLGTTKPCAGPGAGTECTWTAGPVPPGKMFVLGDNRYFSADSSAHLCTAGETECTADPFVDEDLVSGKVLAVVWPRDHIRRLSRPDAFDDVSAPQ